MGNSKFFIIVFFILLFVFTSGHTYAGKVSDQTNAVILPGPLNVTYKDLRNIEMTYQKELNLLTGSIGDIIINDATGSGKGWKVYVEASPVITKDKNGNKGKLSKGSLRIYKQNGTIQGEHDLPQFFDGTYMTIDNRYPKNILEASPHEGMGKFTVSFAADSIRLEVPLYEKGTTYITNIAISIIQGP